LNTFQNIKAVFDAFNSLKVMVIGDVMVDAYLWGKVDRISPEAPVPIVAVHKRESRLGGAANVAINIQSMGAQPILCSVIGNDRHGDDLLQLMRDINITTDGIVKSDSRVTTVKTRVIGNNHQLLRVDDEKIANLTSEENKTLLNTIIGLMDSSKPDVVIFEDYDKGVLGTELINAIVDECIKRNIPTAVDPKKNNFLAYKRVNLFKPNLLELKAGLKLDLDKTSLESLENATEKFRKDQEISALMVTLSEAGVFISSDEEKKIIPAHIRNISDVSGAGDTVISVAALCLALELPYKIIAELANLAGGLVCERIGVVPIDKEQLFHEAVNLKV